MDSMEEQAPTLLHRWSSERCRYILTLRYTINLHFSFFSCLFNSCYCIFTMDGHYKEYMITIIRYGIVLVLVLMTKIHEWPFLGVWFHFSFSFTHTHMTISFLSWCFMFIFLTWGKHFPVFSSFMTYYQVTRLTRRGPLVEQKLLTLPEHLRSPPVLSGVLVTRTLFLCVMFCRSLFVLLSFLFWPLCRLFVDLRILITSMVSSNSSWDERWILKFRRNFRIKWRSVLLQKKHH